ncbi:hypothetical protein B0H67DRAFT_161323 [Lasiosphaeris hirsuta]|uniref:Uncharacterized protein n=1 Tax=Lasiosphaeris hirsuta TaxID=260670 RepID=A0AA40APR6_9PEZI|nr:hypothetical protein B0H67DRAFT_161323 [Lasiosphaeris hirsuta]
MDLEPFPAAVLAKRTPPSAHRQSAMALGRWGAGALGRGWHPVKPPTLIGCPAMSASVRHSPHATADAIRTRPSPLASTLASTQAQTVRPGAHPHGQSPCRPGSSLSLPVSFCCSLARLCVTRSGHDSKNRPAIGQHHLVTSVLQAPRRRRQDAAHPFRKTHINHTYAQCRPGPRHSNKCRMLLTQLVPPIHGLTPDH